MTDLGRTNAMKVFVFFVAVSAISVRAQPQSGRGGDSGWSFDFEGGIPPQIELMDASITEDRRQVIGGQKSVLADFSKEGGIREGDCMMEQTNKCNDCKKVIMDCLVNTSEDGKEVSRCIT